MNRQQQRQGDTHNTPVQSRRQKSCVAGKKRGKKRTKLSIQKPGFDCIQELHLCDVEPRELSLLMGKASSIDQTGSAFPLHPGLSPWPLCIDSINVDHYYNLYVMHHSFSLLSIHVHFVIFNTIPKRVNVDAVTRNQEGKHKNSKVICAGLFTFVPFIYYVVATIEAIMLLPCCSLSLGLIPLSPLLKVTTNRDNNSSKLVSLVVSCQTWKPDTCKNVPLLTDLNLPLTMPATN